MDIIKMDLIIGILGTIILLMLFILNQIGKLNKGSFIYDFGNLIGGSLMVVYSLIIKSWPLDLLQNSNHPPFFGVETSQISEYYLWVR